MKKILFVTYTLGFGGAERSLVNLLHEMSPEQYSVDILLFQKKGGLLKQLPDWVRVLEVPDDLNRLYGPLGKAGNLRWTKLIGTVASRVLRRSRKAWAACRWEGFYRDKVAMLPESYDVAIAYGGSEILYLMRDKAQAGKKLAWIHNDYRTAGYSAKDDRKYLADMDAIVSVSDACCQVLQQMFPELADKVRCIENITSSALIRKRAGEYTPEEYRENTWKLLSIGRLWTQKGFDMAIEAAALLKKQGAEFCWYVIGEGVLRESLEKQIKDCDVADCFQLLGTRDNPYPYIAHCTALIQPSRFEGKSVVLDEAKILAVPIIATAYPTVRDQILEGQEGIIVPMDPQGIADGIRKTLSDPQICENLRSYLGSREYGNRAELQKYLQLLE